MLRAVSILAADSMEGRQTDTEGSARARRWLLAQLDSIGVAPLGSGYESPFRFARRSGDSLTGVNLVGMIRGTSTPEQYLIITAHYDHLGIREGQIYNGADDNASGTAAVLELARRLKATPLSQSVILVLLDAEEMGLRGALHFVATLPVAKNAVTLNINLDMVSRSSERTLWVAGTHHFPQFIPAIDSVAAAAPITLKRGHDSPADGPANDWTMQSDHGAFYRAGIPFLYFGVEDHPGYHQPSDDFEAITPDFFLGAVETIWRVIRRLDQQR